MAITRARNRLWLFESNESSFAPVMRLWAANEPIVEVAYSGDEDVIYQPTPSGRLLTTATDRGKVETTASRHYSQSENVVCEGLRVHTQKGL